MADMIHSFILSPGKWKGEGKIVLNMVQEELIFDTFWHVERNDGLKIECIQQIQVQGLNENMRNQLTFSDFQTHSFVVEMENPNVGRIVGKGIYDPQLIGWEFRGEGNNFEGFETYHLQPDGSYVMHGEYITSDEFRTQISARLWKSAEESPLLGEEEPNEGGLE